MAGKDNLKPCRFELYYIKNNIDGKLYIGQTTAGIMKRWGQHKSSLNKKTKLSNAFEKYGIENFSINKICSFKNIDELNNAEEFLISHLKTTKKGYNIQLGGHNYNRYCKNGLTTYQNKLVDNYVYMMVNGDTFTQFKLLYGLIKVLKMLPDKAITEKFGIPQEQIDKVTKKAMYKLKNGYPHEKLDILTIIYKHLVMTKDFAYET